MPALALRVAGRRSLVGPPLHLGDAFLMFGDQQVTKRLCYRSAQIPITGMSSPYVAGSPVKT
jgi:hypothetical protein